MPQAERLRYYPHKCHCGNNNGFEYGFASVIRDIVPDVHSRDRHCREKSATGERPLNFSLCVPQQSLWLQDNVLDVLERVVPRTRAGTLHEDGLAGCSGRKNGRQHIAAAALTERELKLESQ